MSVKELELSFSKVEIQHILSLIDNNEREGWYYGNKEQYQKRSERIQQKLEIAYKQEKEK